MHKSTDRIWLTGLVISYVGPWVCYAADSQGNIEVFKKGSDTDTILESKNTINTKMSNSNPHALTTVERWEKYHRLGINHILLLREENLLITLSMDTTCKITDPATGHTLFTITNSNKCIYTGVTWIKEVSCFYLVDEVGQVEIFSHFHEKVIDSAPLVSSKTSSIHNVRKSHSGQVAMGLTQYHQRGYFLTLAESLVDTSVVTTTAMTVIIYVLTISILLQFYVIF